MNMASFGELCERYIETLREKEEKEKSLKDTVRVLNELHSRIADKSGEIVLDMCEKQLESLGEKEKGKLKLWIAEQLHCLLFALEREE